jgi:histidine ammonia-lyase
LRSTGALESALEGVRGYVAPLDEDRSLSAELEALATALHTGALRLQPAGG